MEMTINRYPQTKQIRETDTKAIAAYTKAIDVLDDVTCELCFPHADVYRAEIYRLQRRMQDEVFKLEDGYES